MLVALFPIFLFCLILPTLTDFFFALLEAIFRQEAAILYTDIASFDYQFCTSVTHLCFLGNL